MASALTDLKIEINDVQPCVKKLAIEIPAETIADESEKKFREIGKNAQVQGFRKGRVPKPILKKMYAKSILWDVSQSLISSSYEAALDEHKLTPYGEPVIEDVKVDEGKPLSYTATVETLPDVELPDLSKWKFTREIIKVSDDMLQEVMNSYREQNAELVPVEKRGVKEDDHVFLDYTCTIDGKEQENLSGKNRQLIISSKKDNILSGFHKEVEGLKSGDEKEFTIKLPKHFPDPAIAGKEATFKVKLNSIKEKILPELTDEMLAANTPYKTVKEMMEKVRKNMEDGMKNDADGKLRADILDRLIKETSFDLPPKMATGYSEYRANAKMAESKKYGVDMESNPNFKKDEFEKTCREEGDRMAREELIIDAVALKENVAPDQKEVLKRGEEYEKMFRSSGAKDDVANLKHRALTMAFKEVLTGEVYGKLISAVEVKDKYVDEKDKKNKPEKRKKESE